MNLLVYYWSEDAHSEKLKAIIQKILEAKGHEVLACINITGTTKADKGIGIHGQAMVHAFKKENILVRQSDETDPVEKALRLLSDNVMKYKYDDKLRSCNLQLFIVHMDGDLWGGLVKEADDNIAAKICFVANGRESVRIKNTWVSSDPKLKFLACVPVKEIETWLIPSLKGLKTSGKPLDDIESPKEKVKLAMGFKPGNDWEYKTDPEKAKLASDLKINKLLSRSRSYQYFEESINDTLSCNKGQLPEY